jgi:hypothetical protein
MLRRGGVLDTQRSDQLPDRVRSDGRGPRSRWWCGGIGRLIRYRPRYLRHLLPQRKEVRGQRQSPWRPRGRRRTPRGSHQRGDGWHRSTKTRPSRRTDARPSRCHGRWRWRRRRSPQRRHGQAVEPAAGTDGAGFARNRHPGGADCAGSLSAGSRSARSRPSGSRSARSRGSDTGTRRRSAGRCATGGRSTDAAARTRRRPRRSPAAANGAPSLADPAAARRPSTGAHRRSRPSRDTGDIPRRVRRLPQGGDRRRPCTSCAVRHRGHFGDHRAWGAGRVPPGSRRAGVAAREHHERCPIPAMTVAVR